MKLLHIKKTPIDCERSTKDPNMIKEPNFQKSSGAVHLNYSLQRFVQETEALRTWPFATFEPFSGRVLSECSQDRINDKLFLHSKYLFMLNFMAKCQKSPSHISQPFNALWLSLKIESLYFLTSNLDVRRDGTFPRFQLQPVAIKCIGLRFEAHDNEVMENHEMRV